MGADEVLTRDNRPPTYAEALDLFRQGREALKAADDLPRSAEYDATIDREYGRAAVLFAGAEAAASLRLVAPVHFPATGVTDTGRSVR